mmetsp:Transcript_24569/g.75768  ORF Transcript_24569/g.75768 Transcript_24569/m.75768 type:complete len:231 (+) Transcript_24569:508-1200(+)
MAPADGSEPPPILTWMRYCAIWIWSGVPVTVTRRMGMPGTDWAMSTFAPDIWRIWLMVAPARPMTAPMDSLGTWNCTGIVPGASCAGIGGPPYPGCGPPMCCAAMCWPMPYIAAAAPAAAPRFGSGARAAPAGVSSSLCTINVKAAMTCSTVPETTHFRTSGSPATTSSGAPTLTVAPESWRTRLIDAPPRPMRPPVLLRGTSTTASTTPAAVGSAMPNASTTPGADATK